jgi:hypothetical protein
MTGGGSPAYEKPHLARYAPESRAVLASPHPDSLSSADRTTNTSPFVVQTSACLPVSEPGLVNRVCPFGAGPARTGVCPCQVGVPAKWVSVPAKWSSGPAGLCVCPCQVGACPCQVVRPDCVCVPALPPVVNRVCPFGASLRGRSRSDWCLSLPSGRTVCVSLPCPAKWVSVPAKKWSGRTVCVSLPCLKDPIIVNDIFLKTPSRIDALGMVLIIALMVWRLMERSMRTHVKNTGTLLPGWAGRPTDKPTSFMMTTVMAGIMVARVGHRRYLLCPPQEGPMAFLQAMGLDSNAFIDPGFQCTPIIPRSSA